MPDPSFYRATLIIKAFGTSPDELADRVRRAIETHPTLSFRLDEAVVIEAVRVTPADVSRLLSRASIRATDEVEIQGAIERVLVAAGLDVAREVDLGAAGRIDFELNGLRLGIEVKVKGSSKDITEQLSRYAETGRYDAVLLVTTLRRHRMPDELCGVRILVCHLWGAVL